MAPIKNIGKVFPTTQGFLSYLDSIQFSGWKPAYVVAHHTGAPTMKNWLGWQSRKSPISDEQWLKNLAAYYGNNLGWSSGPQFFFTPKNFCVLSPPDRRGIHAASFNSNSWGVEMVGNFDIETWGGDFREKYIDGLACLHMSLGLSPDPYVFKRSGLHFHRDDPLTSKTCPGVHINKSVMISEIKAAMVRLGGGEAPPEKIVVSPVVMRPKAKTGVVTTDGLNVRLQASGKAPAVRKLAKGANVSIFGEAMNGPTKWYRVGDGAEWVSAQFVKVA
jgi:hypothetical protein